MGLDWVTDFLNKLWDFTVQSLTDNVPLIIGSVKAIVIAVAVMSVVPALVWLERRLMGRFPGASGSQSCRPIWFWSAYGRYDQTTF